MHAVFLPIDAAQKLNRFQKSLLIKMPFILPRHSVILSSRCSAAVRLKVCSHSFDSTVFDVNSSLIETVLKRL